MKLISKQSIMKPNLLMLILSAWSICEVGRAGDPIRVDGAILKAIESTAVSAEVSGVIASLNVTEGDTVKTGMEIARIRDNAVRIQAQRAKLGVELARRKKNNVIDQKIADKNKAFSQNELNRALDANRRVDGTYPVSEVDRLQISFDRSVLEAERAIHLQSIAEVEFAVAEVELEQSMELGQRHRIAAPCDGMIVSVEKRKGEWVEPGSTLLKIVQINRLRIEGFVTADQAAQLSLGQLATVKSPEGVTEKPDWVHSAKLVFVSPEINPVNSQVRIYLQVENPKQELRPGLRPTVTLD